MKAKHTLLMLGLVVFSITSCKKTDDNSTTADPNEATTSVQMQKDGAVSDFIVEDANDLFDQAAESNNLNGARPDNTANTNIIPACAHVTVTPGGFPKTITIDFGTSCTDPITHVTRSGKIIINISDSLRHPGAVSTMTFDNYYVNLFKREGTITWTNTTVPPHRSWTRTVVNGKVTAPDGRFWIHNATHSIEQVEGNGTPHFPLDDAFSVTGNSTITNSAGVTRTHTIITALHKKVICHNIDMGSVSLVGPHHTVLLDYGNGTCDNIATISVDGGTPTTIVLP